MKKSGFQTIIKIIHWISIVFLLIWGFGFTIGQELPIELFNRELQKAFYTCGFFGIPISIALIALTSIKKYDSLIKAIIKIVAGIVLSIGTFQLLMNFVFILGFGAWKDYNILYVKKADAEVKVAEQIFDKGALGYGSRRIVKVKPILFIFKTVTPVDTTTLDKNKWKRIDEHVLFKGG